MIDYASTVNNINDVSMQSAGPENAVSPRHFIIEKGLSDARGEVDAKVQVMFDL